MSWDNARDYSWESCPGSEEFSQQVDVCLRKELNLFIFGSTRKQAQLLKSCFLDIKDELSKAGKGKKSSGIFNGCYLGTKWPVDFFQKDKEVKRKRLKFTLFGALHFPRAIFKGLASHRKFHHPKLTLLLFSMSQRGSPGVKGQNSILILGLGFGEGDAGIPSQRPCHLAKRERGS